MSQQSKIGKGNTTVRGNIANGELSVVFHTTEIVNVSKGIVTLKTGGWMTATTKTRMNQAANQYGLGYSVWQKKGEWFVSYKGETLSFTGGMIQLIA